jgi:hypothetical protein
LVLDVDDATSAGPRGPKAFTLDNKKKQGPLFRAPLYSSEICVSRTSEMLDIALIVRKSVPQSANF